jgi:hypothetical protein
MSAGHAGANGAAMPGKDLQQGWVLPVRSYGAAITSHMSETLNSVNHSLQQALTLPCYA